jgi:hypothetical protein
MKKEIYIIVIIVLVALASFGMGRMSVLSTHEKEEVEFIIPDLAKIDMSFRGLNYFASINGTRYYPRGCKAGNRIKEENKTFFKTESDAIKSGFSRAVNC